MRACSTGPICAVMSVNPGWGGQKFIPAPGKMRSVGGCRWPEAGDDI